MSEKLQLQGRVPGAENSGGIRRGAGGEAAAEEAAAKVASRGGLIGEQKHVFERE